jgi:hypothetical protein
MDEVARNEMEKPQHRLEHWKTTDAHAIYLLEQAVWSPWLRRPEQHIVTIAKQFPQTQFLLRNRDNAIIATLTANRINWDGNPASLTTWDTVARGDGRVSDYTKTYIPDGNSLCLMSMNVDPTIQRTGQASRLVEDMRCIAKELEVKHLISPFRPNGYGAYKLEHGLIPFAKYCAMTNENGEPFDPWLRCLSRQGMKPLRDEERSMVIEVPMSIFELYRETYQPNKWREVADGKWECGETGSWVVRGDHAAYIEPNLWGELPIHESQLTLRLGCLKARSSFSSLMRCYRSSCPTYFVKSSADNIIVPRAGHTRAVDCT